MLRRAINQINDPTAMLVFLDWFFVSFHTVLTLFNVFGWIWRKTRRIHLATISLTLISWFGLGFFYGFGYCPLTDWHWQVKRKLGQADLPASYVKYYLDKLTGLNWPPDVVDGIVVVFAIGALLMSILLNVRDQQRRSASS